MSRTTSVIVAAVLTAVTLSLFAADDPLQWGKTPEAYFMTAEERAEWRKIASPEEARRFIDAFHRARGEQFLKDIRTRIDIADQHFKLDKTTGSLTQRGRVYMILGTPNTSRTNREVADTRASIPGAMMPSNILENKAIIGTQWVYERDHLPKELGLGQLKVDFVYDARRGFETIDNVGHVEPQLLRAAELISRGYMAASAAHDAQRSAAPSQMGGVAAEAPRSVDPLWNATPALNGALFEGDAFLSPREEPYYAYTFYLPKSAATLGDWKSALLVTLVRNEAGRQVVSDRQRVDLTTYDEASGARFLDRSVLLPPGRYDGFFALYTPDGGQLLSSHRTSFEVAAPSTQRASALFLTSRIEQKEQQDPLDPFTFVATKYAVRADRQFRANERLAFFTVIANPTGSPAPKLMQRMAFRRDGKEYAKTQMEPAKITQTGPNTFLVGNSFEANTFPAGHYTLVLQVHDMNAPEGSPLRIPGYVLRSEFDVLQ